MMHPSSIQVCIPGFCMSEIAMSLNGHVFEQRQAEKLAMSEIAMSGGNHKRRRVEIASQKKQISAEIASRMQAEEKARRGEGVEIAAIYRKRTCEYGISAANPRCVVQTKPISFIFD